MKLDRKFGFGGQYALEPDEPFKGTGKGTDRSPAGREFLWKNTGIHLSSM